MLVAVNENRDKSKNPTKILRVWLWLDKRGMLLSLNIIMRIKGEKLLGVCCVSFPEETRHTCLLTPENP